MVSVYVLRYEKKNTNSKVLSEQQHEQMYTIYCLNNAYINTKDLVKIFIKCETPFNIHA